ncbi:MFS transporter small subunit [Microbacterium halotolerans]|uniref:MFS transporter small subunit n=1 Tax=Microbacterium halotolerans TaxID=246613 RepID=UPI003B845AD0
MAPAQADLALVRLLPVDLFEARCHISSSCVLVPECARHKPGTIRNGEESSSSAVAPCHTGIDMANRAWHFPSWLAWLVVGVPLAIGILLTCLNAMKLFSRCVCAGSATGRLAASRT